ncbi:MAG: hypothetical protein ACI9W4_003068, partial [Rhodothermales bacterium]
MQPHPERQHKRKPYYVFHFGSLTPFGATYMEKRGWIQAESPLVVTTQQTSGRPLTVSTRHWTLSADPA